jgi:hypothetical protein
MTLIPFFRWNTPPYLVHVREPHGSHQGLLEPWYQVTLVRTLHPYSSGSFHLLLSTVWCITQPPPSKVLAHKVRESPLKNFEILPSRILLCWSSHWMSTSAPARFPFFINLLVSIFSGIGVRVGRVARGMI